MKKLKVDKTFFVVFICMLLLCIIGCVMVYSASSYSAEKNFNNSTYFLVKRLLGNTYSKTLMRKYLFVKFS